jgi:hypothetical protein
MCDEPSENPFCTRRIRPGAIPFLFPDGQNAETLVDRLRTHGWCGEIVGPHGSGKSALLATLIPAIERAGRHVTLVELHDGQRRLPLRLGGNRVKWGRHSCLPWLSRMRPLLGRQECLPHLPSRVFIIDGYEQLSRWSRWRLRRVCRRNNWGLVVTSHASVGLPPLWQTAVTPELAQAVVATLLAGRSSPLSEPELAECLARHRGDLREMLFGLYDHHEALRSKSRAP